MLDFNLIDEVPYICQYFAEHSSIENNYLVCIFLRRLFSETFRTEKLFEVSLFCLFTTTYTIVRNNFNCNISISLSSFFTEFLAAIVAHFARQRRDAPERTTEEGADTDAAFSSEQVVARVFSFVHLLCTTPQSFPYVYLKN